MRARQVSAGTSQTAIKLLRPLGHRRTAKKTKNKKKEKMKKEKEKRKKKKKKEKKDMLPKRRFQ
jgi:hypothetical protein